MKKISLLFSALMAFGFAHGQLALTGTDYTQNFNQIGTALPMGWSLFTYAGSDTLGMDVTSTKFTAASTLWNNTGGSFKNFASATPFAFYASGTSALQHADTNRALGVRQVSPTSTSFPGTDSGVAFALNIANTVGIFNLELSFKLQSLDSTSGRVSLWQVQYGIGNNPTSFSTVPPTSGSLTTGASTFSNNTININFGNTLDNISSPIWIRIVSLTPTTGSGNRASTGIDDFHLTWLGSPAPIYNPIVTGVTPLDNATGVVPGTNLVINFDKAVTAGSGNIYVKNVNTQAIQTKAATSSDVVINGSTVTINNVTLLNGNNYHVTYDSAAFDTAGYKCYGVYDTTDWNFATAPAVITVTSLNEDFNDCATSALATGWVEYNVIGSQKWSCTGTSPNFAMNMNGFSGGAMDNEDWLISPKLNLSAMTKPMITWKTRWTFNGPDLGVFVSTNYSGSGNPSSATWTALPLTYDMVDSGNWVGKEVNVQAYKATPFFFAYKYTSNPIDNAARWFVDSVITMEEPMGIKTIASSSLPLMVIGAPQSNEIQLLFTTEINHAATITLFDMTGRMVMQQELRTTSGKNLITINTPTLNSGMYLVRIDQKGKSGLAKAIVQ